MSGRSRRHGGQLLMACVSACVLTSAPLFGAETFAPYEAGEVPRNVADLWRDYDARKEGLEVRVVREWKAEGVVTRYVTFKVDLSCREGQRILSRIRMVDAPDGARVLQRAPNTKGERVAGGCDRKE